MKLLDLMKPTDLDLEKMEYLAESEEAEDLVGYFQEGEFMEGEAVSFESLLQRYIKKAISLDLSPLYWVVDEDELGYMGIALHTINNPLNHGVRGKEATKAFDMCLKAGAYPLLWSATYSADDFLGVLEEEDAKRELKLISENQLMDLMFSSGKIQLTFPTSSGFGYQFDYSLTKAQKESLWRFFMEHATQDESMVKALHQRYQDIMSRSNKNSQGVLGAGDKRAKELATQISANKQWVLALPWPEGSKEIISDIFTDAFERLNQKEKAQGVDLNAALTSFLTQSEFPDARGFYQMMQELLFNHFDQKNAITLLLQSSDFDWIKKHPVMASVVRQGDFHFLKSGRKSLMHQCMTYGIEQAMPVFEKANVNVWLTAAQAGDGNAVRFVMRETGEGMLGSVAAGPVFAESYAKMLFKGAWLNGEQDPKQKCLDLLQEELALARSESKTNQQALGEAILAVLERMEIEDIVGSIHPDLHLAESSSDSVSLDHSSEAGDDENKAAVERGSKKTKRKAL